jgi:hypothetical protein
MRRSLLLGLAVLAAPCPASAQAPVVVDWRTKTLGQHPSAVDRTTPVLIRVEHVNDVHFTYSIQLSGTAREHFDASAISSPRAALALTSACQDALDKAATPVDDMSKAVAAFLELPETVEAGCSAASPCDVTLDTATSRWGSGVAAKLSSARDKVRAATGACTNEPNEVLARMVQKLDQALALDARVSAEEHVATKPDVLLPDQDYVLTIVQIYQGKPTRSGTATLELKPASNRLTLSAGVLFSEIQNRSYASVTAPAGTGSTTANVLSVNGVSQFSPTLATLLNYQLPWLDSDDVGVTISSGPIFRLGTKSDTSTFGYFAGVSVHLFHRFFITPGMHLGEFADFPPGFTDAGQTVPTGLSTPTPVKRWTWRFGFSLTYKARDFGSFGLGGTVSTPDKGSNGGTGAGKTPH